MNEKASWDWNSFGWTRIDKRSFDTKTRCLQTVFDAVVVSEDKIVSADDIFPADRVLDLQITVDQDD